MLKTLKNDIKIVLERDPASRNYLEVIFCYPGLHALILYKISHWFWVKHFFLIGRLISHFARIITGIEIHPGAKIGNGFFIDHGMGVVIGETVEIHDNCTIYQGATLGGLSLKKEKRHPTLDHNVVVGAGAKILGPVKIGANCKIGAGSVVLQDVPANSTVIGVPGRVIYRGESDPLKSMDIDMGKSTDPVAQAIKCLLEKIPQLEKEIQDLKNSENQKNLSYP
jgi:serine O-acetyltransferase